MQKNIPLKKWFSYQLAIRIIASICAFFCIYLYFQSDIGKWETSPDTHSYAGKNYWTDPWAQVRTPGLSMYWTLIGEIDEMRHAIKKFPNTVDFNKIGRSDEKVNLLGKKLVFCNILLLATSFSFLCFSISCIIHPLASLFFILASIYLGVVPSPKHIMADLPACAMTVFFVAFGILYTKYKQFIFLFLLCTSAIIACLIKPGMFFLPFIAGCMLAYEFVSSALARNLKRTLITSCAGIFLVLGTLLWPLLLYAHSGIFVPSQLNTINKAMFATYLLQEGDDQLFTEPKHKAFVAELIKHKPEKDAEIDKLIYKNTRNSHSKANIYLNSVNSYGYQFFFIIMGKCGLKMSEVAKARFVKNISGPIIKKHFQEYMLTIGRSFLSAFGYYKDLSLSIWRRHKLGAKSFWIFIFCYVFLLCTIVFGAKRLRYPLLLLALIHVMSVVFMSIGHAVLQRYLEITEWSFILALEVALYSVVLRLHFFVTSRRRAFP